MTESKYWKVDIDSDTVLMRCCDEIQFEYYCTTCGEKGGCYYCDFNPADPCECVLKQWQSVVTQSLVEEGK
jgi:hypothetical protein